MKAEIARPGPGTGVRGRAGSSFTAAIWIGVISRVIAAPALVGVVSVGPRREIGCG
jgi:hypothetical protein